MGSKGSNTTTSSNAPPQQYLAEYSAVNNLAQQVGTTPYSSYPGQSVAQLSPDQSAGIGQVEDLTANGGVQSPYLQSAQNYFGQATQPLLSSIPTVNNSTLSGLGATGLGEIQQEATGLSQANINQFESPYTQQVVGATEAQLNNQNAQQQQQVASSAAQQGAYGGDREAVAQGITAGQQQLAEAPTIANLENTGYQTGLQGAEAQAGLEGQAATQNLGFLGQQQQTELGANEANAWLASQAGFGEANLGSEAQSTGLQGASALLGAGSIEQQEAQSNLNVPYEQYLAAQAYPYQTTSWLANIAEGLGGSSGGTTSTTSPGPNVGSEVAGLGTGSLGVLGATGAFGNNGYLTGTNGLFSSGAGSTAGVDAGTFAYQHGGPVTRPHNLGAGLIPKRADGGDVSLSIVPAGGLPASPISTDPSSIVPTGTAAGSGGTQDIMKNFGSTSTTSGGPSGLAQLVGLGGQVAATVYGGPLAGAAAGAFNQEVGLRRGGMTPHRDDGGGVTTTMTVTPDQSTESTPPTWYAPLVQETLDNQMAQALGTNSMASGGMVPPERFAMGGMSSSEESPWWARSEEREATDRHGLLASPIAGRTDHLAISPASGSYVIPADVVSGLGEGNTLAGANVMQRILETGPHGTPLPRAGRGMAPPKAPPAYHEGMGDDGMAAGGSVLHRATGGMSAATSNYLSPAATSNMVVEGTPGGINASTGVGSSNTGIPALDNYLNSTEAMASFAPPPTYVSPVAPAAAAAPSAADAAAQAAQQQAMIIAMQSNAGGAEKRGGMVRPHRDDGGYVDSGSWDAPSPSSGGMMPATVDSASTLPTTGMPPPSSGSLRTTGEPMAQGSRFHLAEADPWLAVAQAGFGMAAGRSPHALENIGAGAEKGVQFYEQQKNEANKENLTADDAQARIAETKAYHEAMAGARNTSADAAHIRADAYSAFTSRKADLQAQGLDEKSANDQAMNEWRMGTLGVQQQNATTNARNADTRSSLGAASLDLRRQTLEALIAQKGIQNDQKARADLAHQIGQMTDEQIRAISAGRNPITGVAPTPAQAGQTVQDMRHRSQQTIQPTPAPATPAPPAGGAAPPPVASYFQ